MKPHFLLLILAIIIRHELLRRFTSEVGSLSNVTDELFLQPLHRFPILDHSVIVKHRSAFVFRDAVIFISLRPIQKPINLGLGPFFVYRGGKFFYTGCIMRR